MMAVVNNTEAAASRTHTAKNHFIAAKGRTDNEAKRWDPFFDFIFNPIQIMGWFAKFKKKTPPSSTQVSSGCVTGLGTA